MPIDLEDLEVHEISLVKNPAVPSAKFLILKHQEEIDEMSDKKELSPELTSKLEEILKAEKLEGDKAQKVKDALKILNEIKGDVPPAIFNMLAGLVGYPTAKSADDPPAPKPEPEPKPELAPEVKAQLEEIKKAKEDSDAKIAELQKSLDAEKEKALTKEYLEKAAGYSHVPMKTEDLGALMKDVSAKIPEHSDKLIEMLKAVDGAIGQSEILQERGSNLGGTRDVEEKINAKVKELITKNTGLTKEQAYVQVLNENPELYSEYEAKRS